MKTKTYKGWKIYKTAGGSNNRMAQINAKNPLRVSKLSATVPDNGNERIALAHVMRDIDALETGNPT